MRQFRDWYLGCGQMALDHLPRRASDLILVDQFLGARDQAAAYWIDALLAKENEDQNTTGSASAIATIAR
jgi:hypothetical protein